MKHYSLLTGLLSCILLVISGKLAGQDQAINLLGEAQYYYIKGEYRQAEIKYRELLTAFTVKDKNSVDYYRVTEGLAKIHAKKKNYIQADSLYEELHGLAIALFGENSKEYRSLVNNRAALYVDRKLPDEAIRHIDLIADTYREQDAEYVKSLNILGESYLLKGNLTKVDSLSKTALDIHLALGNQAGDEYANSLALQAALSYKRYNTKNKEYLKKAADLYLAYLAVINKTYGHSHVESALAKHRIAKFYLEHKSMKYMLDILQPQLPVIEKSMGTQNMLYADVLCDLGTAMLDLSDYMNAIEMLSRSSTIVSQCLGEDNSYFLSVQTRLGVAYSMKGEYNRAGVLLEKSLKTSLSLHGESHSLVKDIQGALAHYHWLIGDYSKALQYWSEIIEEEQKDLSRYSEDYVFALYRIALILEDKKMYHKACEMIMEANNHIVKFHMSHRPVSLEIIKKMTTFLLIVYGLDETWYEEQWKSIRSVAGEKESYSYYIHLGEYASGLAILGNHAKAADLYEQIAIAMEKYSNDKDTYITALFNCTEMFKRTGNQMKVAEYHEKTLQCIRQQLSENFIFLSEAERYWYWKKHHLIIQQTQSLANDGYPDEITRLLYDNELINKSLLLTSNRAITRTVAHSKDEKLIALWNEWVRVKEELIRLETSESENDDKGLLQEKLISMEKEIMRSSDLSGAIQKNLSYKWQDIRESLDDTEVAIEFFSALKANNKRDSVLYIQLYALVLDKHMEQPLLVKLCKEDELEGKTGFQHSETVSQLIWQPLEKHLTKYRNIYIAPTGALHSVSFNGLTDSEGRYALDRYTIHNVLTTKDIPDLKKQQENRMREKKALLFGGADYGLPRQELIAVEKTGTEGNNTVLTRGILDEMNSYRGQGFDYLPNSKIEVDFIRNYISKKNWETKLFTDQFATETSFKQEVHSFRPSLLHISTHGYFFPEKEKGRELETDGSQGNNTFRTSENPLIRSGLLFSGANHVWSGNDTDHGTDDGVLTAYEISNLNLSSTRLVVLSACVTGLGDIDRSEGVHGLQRAFRLSGASSLIVSLWDVPDKETKELMTSFYQYWIEGGEIKKAFDKAQKEMKKNYPDDLRKWAGFILIE